MNRLFSYVSAILILISISSCTKLNDDDVTDNPLLGEDVVKWSYSLSDLLGAEIVEVGLPAFDDVNNGYYLVEIDATTGSTEENKAWVVAVDKVGVLLWKSEITDAPESDLNDSYLAYTDGKIVVSTTTKVVCLNAQTGVPIWSVDSNRIYWVNSMSVTQGKIFYIESTLPMKLVGLNLSDGSQICAISLNKTGEDIRGNLTLITGSKLVVSVSDINNNGEWYTGLNIFDINSLTNESIPSHSFTTATDYYPVSSCLLSSDANAVLFLAQYHGSENIPDRYLISVSETGVENWKTEVPEDIQQLFTDAQGNIYAFGNDNLLKITSSGQIAYQNNILFGTYFNEFQIAESNVFYGNVGDCQTDYESDCFATFSLTSGTEILRNGEYFPYAQMEGSSIAVNEENDRRSSENCLFRSGKKVIDAEGNILSISSKNIYCLLGPNHKLMPGAWAKRNGNIGNTNSW